MADWKDWSDGWLKEGHYLCYARDAVTYYERVWRRDIAHYVYKWPVTVVALTDSGPYVPGDLEVTAGYDEAAKLNNIWQLIFGIKGQAYIYVELPTDTKRHGLFVRPWHTRELREVAHFEEWMSSFNQPTFVTEHFMMRPDTHRIDFSAYNPNNIDLTDLQLNIFVAKLITQRIGSETYTEEGLRLTATRPHWKDILDRLYRQLVPCRPISHLPVTGPAAAP